MLCQSCYRRQQIGPPELQKAAKAGTHCGCPFALASRTLPITYILRGNHSVYLGSLVTYYRGDWKDWVVLLGPSWIWPMPLN